MLDCIYNVDCNWYSRHEVSCVDTELESMIPLQNVGTFPIMLFSEYLLHCFLIFITETINKYKRAHILNAMLGNFHSFYVAQKILEN